MKQTITILLSALLVGIVGSAYGQGDRQRQDDRDQDRRQDRGRDDRGIQRGRDNTVFWRPVKITVRGDGPERGTVPIAGATVRLSTGQSGRTDRNGEVVLISDEENNGRVQATVTPPNAQFGRVERVNLNLNSGKRLTRSMFDDNDWLRPYKGRQVNTAMSDNFAREWTREFGRNSMNNATVTLKMEREMSRFKLDGYVRAEKGRHKAGDRVSIEIGTYFGGGNMLKADARVTMKVYNPSGRQIASEDFDQHLTLNTNATRRFDVRCNEVGEYIVRVTATARDMKTWTADTKFSVSR